MDPPPVYVQIQVPQPRKRRAKQKTKFMNVSEKMGPRTSNYHIHKLADGRIGQQRKVQVIHSQPIDTEQQEGLGVNEAAAGDADNNLGESMDVDADEAPPEKPKTKKKPLRKSAPDTWAVRSFHCR